MRRTDELDNAATDRAQDASVSVIKRTTAVTIRQVEQAMATFTAENQALQIR